MSSDMSVGLSDVRKKLYEDLKVGAQQLKAGFTPSFAQNFEISNALSTGQVRSPQERSSAASL